MGNWVFLEVFKLFEGEKLIWVYDWALLDSLSLGFVNEEYFEWTGGWIMFVIRGLLMLKGWFCLDWCLWEKLVDKELVKKKFWLWKMWSNGGGVFWVLACHW